MPRWSKEKIIERIKGYSNFELLRETILLSAGDDYEGCHTDEGYFTFAELQKELKHRLITFNWITAEETKDWP